MTPARWVPGLTQPLSLGAGGTCRLTSNEQSRVETTSLSSEVSRQGPPGFPLLPCSQGDPMSCCEMRCGKARQAENCRLPVNRSKEAPQTRLEAHTSTAAAGHAEAEAPHQATLHVRHQCPSFQSRPGAIGADETLESPRRLSHSPHAVLQEITLSLTTAHPTTTSAVVWTTPFAFLSP